MTQTEQIAFEEHRDKLLESLIAGFRMAVAGEAQASTALQQATLIRVSAEQTARAEFARPHGPWCIERESLAPIRSRRSDWTLLIRLRFDSEADAIRYVRFLDKTEQA